MSMTATKALAVQKEFEALAAKHGLWLTIKHEKKPELKMIKIEEISIKITETEERRI